MIAENGNGSLFNSHFRDSLNDLHYLPTHIKLIYVDGRGVTAIDYQKQSSRYTDKKFISGYHCFESPSLSPPFRRDAYFIHQQSYKKKDISIYHCRSL